MSKLSPFMLEAYKCILEHPHIEFIKIGGFRRWTYPDCEIIKGYSGDDRPVFEIQSPTVEALIKRGLLESLDKEKDFYAARYKAVFNNEILASKEPKINSKEYIYAIAEKYDFQFSKDGKFFRLNVHSNPKLGYFKSKGHGAIFSILLKEHFNKYKKLNFERIFRMVRKYFETKKNSIRTLEIYKKFEIYPDRILLIDPVSSADLAKAKIVKIDKYLLKN